MLLFLGITFIVINFLIKSTRGNHKLIKKKLFIGILIITLTAMLQTPAWSRNNKDILHNPAIEFDNAGKPDIILHFPFQFTINYYSYCITDLSKNFIESGEIKATDGTFDGEVVEFKFTINSKIAPGKYRLYIYDIALDNPEQKPGEDFIGLYKLTITKNEIMCYQYFY